MLVAVLLGSRVALVIAIALRIAGYIGVLRKMEFPAWNAILPPLADWRLSTVLFKYPSSFWRPLVVAAILCATGCYLNPFEGTGTFTAKMLILAATVVYSLVLIRLYWRLGKCFGKGVVFRLFLIVLPELGLIILGFGKARYLGAPVFRPRRTWPKPLAFLFRVCAVLLSAVELLALLAVVAVITLRTYQPEVYINYNLQKLYEENKDVVGGDSIVSREDSMGSSYASLGTMPRSREKFFPDHSSDKNVVVLAYIIGSNLEDAAGLATVNLTQMLDATKQGSALTFVLECGGSPRWIMDGIDNKSYGRYEMRDGSLKKVLELPGDTCMSEQQSLEDFLVWVKETYPADRYMLVLWDHGGGLSSGYGSDDLNKRESDLATLQVDEIVQSIANSGITFDVVGFDACLMQDIEIVDKLEPYTDYYAASEETESGSGWFYTSPFGKLAQNPGMSTEDFGRELIACYDPYNRDKSTGEPHTDLTLSFVDTTLAKPAYEMLEGLFDSAHQSILDDSANYANLSLAGTQSYTFLNKEQVDLVDFLENLGKIDYDDMIYNDEQLAAISDAVKASVVYRNADSAMGINGMALSFPVGALMAYNYEYGQLNSLGLQKQLDFYNDFFSIEAAQNLREQEERAEDGTYGGFFAVTGLLLGDYYAKEPWYVPGFENYEVRQLPGEIPLTQAAGGYQIGLPTNMWPLIANTKMDAFQRSNDGLLRYLGAVSTSQLDADGHAMICPDDSWVNVGGRLVCYQDTGMRETENGLIYTGTTKAKLNGLLDVTVLIEWNPVASEQEAPVTGKVVGYELDLGLDSMFGALREAIGEDIYDLASSEFGHGFEGKANGTFRPGDRLEFKFDYYDTDGKLVKSENYGRLFVVKRMEDIDVSRGKLPESDLLYSAVITDVYQRTMQSDMVEEHVS